MNGVFNEPKKTHHVCKINNVSNEPKKHVMSARAGTGIIPQEAAP